METFNFKLMDRYKDIMNKQGMNLKLFKNNIILEKSNSYYAFYSDKEYIKNVSWHDLKVMAERLLREQGKLI